MSILENVPPEYVHELETEIERLRAGWEKCAEVGRENIRRHFEESRQLRERAEQAEARLELLTQIIEGLKGVVDAAEDVAEGACSFKDARLSYEEWQINPGSMERLRAAIAAIKSEPLAAAQPEEKK